MVSGLPTNLSWVDTKGAADSRRLSESFHLGGHPVDSLGEPYVSSASSQQQYQDHGALLPYHANEAVIQATCRAADRRERLTSCLMGPH
ncbi:hypothetical protein EXN66_Car020387 [Channa argus]|uniref:Uncharacterized protein n=1 Tax=Channa argus TaxID=215402 RepID=A0A6G1QQF0_CHAAH|nr:hypothetical protein EXN66_Car020387 [Channa argus]